MTRFILITRWRDGDVLGTEIALTEAAVTDEVYGMDRGHVEDIEVLELTAPDVHGAGRYTPVTERICINVADRLMVAGHRPAQGDYPASVDAHIQARLDRLPDVKRGRAVDRAVKEMRERAVA